VAGLFSASMLKNVYLWSCQSVLQDAGAGMGAGPTTPCPQVEVMHLEAIKERASRLASGS
jgi:hypothetical protein